MNPSPPSPPPPIPPRRAAAQVPLDPLRYRALFPVCRARIYLDHAAVCPVSAPLREATTAWLDAVAALGIAAGPEQWEETADRGRQLAAGLIGCEPHEVAYVRNTSHGLALVAEGIDWAPGDEVAVCRAVEYPSNVYVWEHLASRGVVIRDIEPDEGGVSERTLRAALTDRTRLIAVSSVQYATGVATDLDAVGRIAADHGALVCVDAIQSLGVSPLRARERGLHFASADSHKWMLGVLGIGVMYVHESQCERLRPALVGWKSTTDPWNFDRARFELRADAARFEEGSLPYPLIYGLVAAMELLRDAGIERIEAHVTTLLARLEAGLRALGAEVGPPPERRAGILTARFPGDAPERSATALAAQLASEGVVVSARRGRLRIAPHLYNTDSDIEALLTVLRRVA